MSSLGDVTAHSSPEALTSLSPNVHPATGAPRCQGSVTGWVRSISPTWRSADNGVCPQMCLQHKPDVFGICNIYDTYGVHYTFGLPGLLGGITDIVLKALQVKWTEVSM